VAVVRAAIVGTGNIARTHARSYRATPGVEVVAACDVVPGKAEGFVREWGIPAAYRDVEEMVERERPDLVSICTRVDQHVEPTIRAARPGVKLVFVEKPMAMNLAEADRMIAACRGAGVRLATDHTQRWEPGRVLALGMLREGRIGDLIGVHVHCPGDLGELHNNGTHWFDAMRMYAGDARWVVCHVLRDPSRREDREAVRGMVGFEGGVVGTIAYGGFHDYRRGMLTLEGSRGQLRLANTTSWTPQVRLWLAERDATDWVQCGQPVEVPVGDPFEGAIGAMVRAVREDRDPESDGLEGRKSVELLIACYESHRRGNGRVDLPLPDGLTPLEDMRASGALPSIFARGLGRRD
jgi:predicted dehydrogenase